MKKCVAWGKMGAVSGMLWFLSQLSSAYTSEVLLRQHEVYRRRVAQRKEQENLLLLKLQSLNCESEGGFSLVKEQVVPLGLM